MRTNSTRFIFCSFFAAIFLYSGKTFSQAIMSSNFEQAKVPNPPPGWVIKNTNNANWQSLSAVGYDGNEYNGNKCMYLANSYYGDQSDAWLISPEFYMEAGKKYSISFFYKNQVSNLNQLQVTLGSDTLPASQTEIIWDNRFRTDYYSKGQINYIAKETGIKHLGFHATTARTYTYMYLDKVAVEQVSCFEPLQLQVSNIGVNSISLKWKAGVAPLYEYGINSVMEPPTQTSYIDSSSINLSNLTAATHYYFFIRSVCSKTEKSKWAMQEFSTAYDTAGIESILCGTKFSNVFLATQGLYLQPICQETYFGLEFFHKFTPRVSGEYNLHVYSVNIGQTMAFAYKDASLGAGPNDWICIGSANDRGKLKFGPLEAGKEYLILEKARAAVGLPSSYKYAIDCITSAVNSVVATNINVAGNNIKVFPNPAKDKFTVTLNETKSAKYKISIVGMNGNTIKAITTNIVAGYNQLTIDATNLRAGIYILKIETPTGTQYQKVVKQ